MYLFYHVCGECNITGAALAPQGPGAQAPAEKRHLLRLRDDANVTGAAVATGAVSEQRVKEIIAAVYGRSPHERALSWQEIESDFPLYSLEEGEESLGLDSLDAVEIATELEEAFDVVLPTEIEPAQLRTVRDVVAALERLLGEQRA